MIDYKVIQYFFRQAEIGNWQVTSIDDVEKKFNIKNKAIYKAISDKQYFFSYYSELIDKKVIHTVTEEDIEISTVDEIIQELLMNKLELMSKNKLAIANIFNFYITSPKFILKNLMSSKETIKIYLEMFDFSGNIVKKQIIIKLILGVWFLAFRKWLYEEENNNISFSIIDKGLKKIKKNTNLFNLLNKKNDYSRPVNQV